MKKTLIALSALSAWAVYAQAPVSSVSVSSSSLEQRIAQLERIVQARTDAQIEMTQQLAALQQDVSELRGVTEEHAYRLEQLVQRQRELYQEIDRRMQQLNTSGASTATANVNISNLNTVPVTSSNDSGSQQASQYSNNLSENDAYDKAIKLVLEDKRYDAAIPQFKAFLEKFPDSTYAPNAHYWLGQLLFAQRKYDESKQHFTAVVDKFPDSNKRGESLLKLGVIAEEKGDNATAQSIFQKVIEQYPDSTEAGLAKKRLK
ncbi:tol-pal system protein YbgF [Idiomarina tyrosinivorans]|uniref:Cell division coordinator CpoB n=1 Tax=Idiomarina tyrosinivorans TaxID=1445662 RepID=A0A432ZPW0_9GAMM|nr:tol-pal system protein YbgF [Idiomarina tyrosinivorans]RUO79868.1 tol-pal system protein YbgF [Idiomarina tyrosinivorans]